MSPLRILLTGRDGQVGRDLVSQLAPLGAVTACGRAEMDLAAPGHCAAIVRDLAPDVVVNAAAYTAVDPAEAEEALATRINAHAPAAMAAAAHDCGALFVHYSTDYVFDGEAQDPYTEDALTAPRSAYGRSKALGEALIRDSGCAHLILRTAWVYAPHGRNFLLTMLRLARERERLAVVADQIGSPTSSPALAQLTAALIRGTTAGASRPALRETLHTTCSGSTSWHGFASRIVERGAALGLCPLRPVDPITSADHPTAAVRPRYSVLDGTRLRARHGINPPAWEAALEAVLQQLHPSAQQTPCSR